MFLAEIELKAGTVKYKGMVSWYHFAAMENNAVGTEE